MRRLGLEREIVDEAVLERAAARCRSLGVTLPTFEELADPDWIPAATRERLIERADEGLFDVEMTRARLALEEGELDDARRGSAAGVVACRGPPPAGRTRRGEPPRPFLPPVEGGRPGTYHLRLVNAGRIRTGMSASSRRSPVITQDPSRIRRA